MPPKHSPINVAVTPEAVPRLRILLVDDSAPFRRMVERILHPFPSLVLIGEAADGISGVEMALALHPDIIVMDVQMPGLNGIEATRRIRTGLPQVCVIGMSVMDHPAIHEEMLAAGASASFPKYCAITLPEIIRNLPGSYSQ